MQVIIASAGTAGGGQQGNIPRPDTTAPGEELVRQRADEARCAMQALGIPPPIPADERDQIDKPCARRLRRLYPRVRPTTMGPNRSSAGNHSDR